MLQHDKPKIGVYICHCGMNIAPKVDVEEVVRYSQTLDHVAVARDYEFMCSNPGQELIVNDIKTYGLNRIVEASCSPRMHEATFQKACEQAGLNPYYLQMANIREQSSWVTLDTIEATAKAKDLVAAAVMRVVWHAPLETREVAVKKSVLIIGGGIAGMQAALTTAEAGFDVHLVEREPSIGGQMAKLDKTFPTLDCAACISTPKTVSIGQHPNITLYTYSEVTHVSGFVGNYEVTLRRKPRYVIEDKCTGCGDCTEVCPIGMVSTFDEGLSERKAVYRSFPQAVPATFCIDKKGTAPCKAACPAHVAVQGFIALIRAGKNRQALELFKQEHPFPGVCGRICHHPCESICSRGDTGGPLAIRSLHRFLADEDLYGESQYVPAVEEKREEKVAVVGAGPAGLTCAYFLAQKGYQATVFEKLPVAGGMMAVGIPEYRLPKDILEIEIETIEKMGVTIKTGVTFGTDITLNGMKNDGFKAAFLATGLHGSRKLGVEGEDLQGVLPGVAFLKDVALGKPPALGPKVVVVGGGNVAVDVALTAKRLGAEAVTMVCLESREEMPAWENEIEELLEEKVEIINCFGPNRFAGTGGIVSGIEFKRCTCVFDADGCFSPEYDPTELQVLPADTVIVAIGQTAVLDFAPAEDIPVEPHGGIEADPVTLQTSIPWVFAGGDAVYGPKSVVEAVACGKEAAESIHRFINDIDLTEGRSTEWTFSKPEITAVPPIARTAMKRLEPEKREGNFNEILLGFSQDQIAGEAGRCLNCGGCSECMQCVKACEVMAVDHDMQEEVLNLEIGALIIATGYKPFDPTPLEQYGYGRFTEVYTSMQFERLNNATGPTGGKIVMKNGRPPRRVAIIHCVGSRDLRHRKYCSRVCCMYSMKFAHLIREKTDAEVWEFYIDIRAPGKLYEEFYNRVQEEGVHFVRGKVAEVTDIPEDPADKGRLIVVAENTLTRRTLRMPVDMVILSVGLEPAEGSEEIGRITGVSRDQDGWFNELHAKLAPVSTPVRGIFLAGCCQGPKDIPDTVAQSLGAAGEAIALLSKGTVRTRAAISYIDPDLCAGCQSCIQICAYSAIHFDAAQSISKVNEALCQGCGSCSAVCPSSAAGVRHFTNRQVMGEIEALLW